MSVDVIEAARGCIGKSRYQLKALPEWAPGIVDCSSFTQWLASLRGIMIPRLAYQQQQMAIPIPRGSLRALDLVFIVGKHGQRREDLLPGQAGHIGMATSPSHMIHAANPLLGVTEVHIDSLIPERVLGFGRLPTQNRP